MYHFEPSPLFRLDFTPSWIDAAGHVGRSCVCFWVNRASLWSRRGQCLGNRSIYKDDKILDKFCQVRVRVQLTSKNRGQKKTAKRL